MNKLFINQPVFWHDPVGMRSGEYRLLETYDEYNKTRDDDEKMILIDNDTSKAEVFLTDLELVIKNIRALTYTKSGINLKDISIPAVQINPHVYIANPHRHNWQTNRETWWDVYLDINGIFCIHNEFTEAELHQTAVTHFEQMACNRLNDILTNENCYPRLLEIEIIKRLGMKSKIEMLFKRKRALDGKSVNEKTTPPLQSIIPHNKVDISPETSGKIQQYLETATSHNAANIESTQDKSEDCTDNKKINNPKLG